jgi:hypothetical protein
MKYQGGCHCGQVKFEAEGELKQVMQCNCTICSRKGSLLWFIPRDKFNLLTPEKNASTYTFNKHTIKHRFCPKCGIHPYAEAIDPRSGKPMAAINTRCLEGVDLDALSVKHFDGRAL